MINIAIFSIHPAPYRDPLYTFISQNREKLGFDIKVFYYQSIDKGHAYWDLSSPHYKFEIVKPLLSLKKSNLQLHLTCLKHIFSSKFDVLIFPGFMHLTSNIGFLLCILFKKKFAIEADTVEDSSSKIRLLLKKIYYKNALFVIVPGNRSSIYHEEKFKIAHEKIVKGSYLFDVYTFRKKIDEYRAVSNLREIFGISEHKKVFLMVANILPKRMYPLILRAFESLIKEYPDLFFLMVGSGTDFKVLERYTNLKKENFKVIQGSSFDEIKKIYSIADVYIHSGKEPYSSALIIGAIAGLPLVSSYQIGASWDVLEDGESGFLVKNYESMENWAAVIKKAYLNSYQWKIMGKKAFEKASNLTAAKTAQRLSTMVSR